jgi:putative membrane-bound dehydrogenase-like protein
VRAAAQSGKPPAFDPSARTHTEAELLEFLKPVPPKPPAEALKTFETVAGFRMELVAAEPLLRSPVAAAFDENGRLYVAELRDYPYLPRTGQKPLGGIRLLEDTNGGGVFDKSAIFADGLLWPAGIAPYKGGVFVSAPPDIWYFKDTDGDGKADIRRKIFTGFSTKNPQGILNNLVLGLDHKIYGSTSVNGGTIRRADDPTAPPIRVDGRDFRFDPETLHFETITGTVQFGNTFDDWGNRFLCSESQPLLHAVLPQHYLARNPFLPVPTAINNLAPAPVPIFRTSPPERWRIIRSSRRIKHGERPETMPGASHHVVDAAAGVTVYRGGAYPKEYYGSVFTGEAQNNLVHRRLLVPDGPTFKSVRGEPKTEFVRSGDNWFRPVNFVNAPDGTLYVLDMSREILEAIHIPLDVLKFLDLANGRDSGRIYRMAPPGFKYPGTPSLGKAAAADLVKALESPHGWWRDTAQRLICERQEQAAIEPLRRLVRKGALAQARVHALWSLHGLKALSDGDLIVGLRDTVPGVRENAVRLAETRLKDSAALRTKVIAMTGDGDARVRLQVAFTLGEVKNPAAVTALIRLAREQAENAWMRTAIFSSVTESAPAVLAGLLADAKFAANSAGPLDMLASIVGVRNRPEELEETLLTIAGAKTAKDRLLLSLGQGLKRAGARLPSDAMSPGSKFAAQRLGAALKISLESKNQAERAAAIKLLGCYAFRRTRLALGRLLEPGQPQEIQLAAVRALGEQPDEEVAGLLLRGWRDHVPAVQTALIQALLLRESWTLALLESAAKGQLAQVEPARRELLLKHRNPAIRAAARKHFGDDPLNPRKQVIAEYEPVLKLAGDSRRGHNVFAKNCSVCHKVRNEGFAVGPDLVSPSQRDPAALLVHILDPNRYVAPNYLQYVIVDKNGRVLTGAIAAETATSVTLRREKNQQDTLLRSEIDEMTSTGRSLMPEGFEKQIDRQEMADLLAFLVSIQGPPALDIGTEGGMVEPEKKGKKER